jgi:hypothetical protein
MFVGMPCQMQIKAGCVAKQIWLQQESSNLLVGNLMLI